MLICEVFWLKTKGWKVCWFGVVWCWCCVFVLGVLVKDQRLEGLLVCKSLVLVCVSLVVLVLCVGLFVVFW